jgi:hypothetical protein
MLAGRAGAGARQKGATMKGRWMLLAAAVTTSGVANAQGRADNLGNAGQLVIGVDRLSALGWYELDATSEASQSGTSVKSTMEQKGFSLALLGAGGSVETMTPRVGLDYLIADGPTLGIGGLFLSRTREQTLDTEITSGAVSTKSQGTPVEATATLLILHPRLGFVAQLDETFALWPRGGVQLVQESIESDDPSTDPSGNNVTYEDTDALSFTLLTLEGMVSISPVPHFTLLIGPFVDIPLGGSMESETTEPNVPKAEGDMTITEYGLAAGIAGYL